MLRLTLRETTLAVARLPAADPLPAWAAPDAPGFVSVTRTAEELSVVCPQDRVPQGVPAERGWRAFSVEGPLDFGLTGVLAALVSPLARAGVPVFVISTYDTDHVLVREASVPAAAEAMRAAGHRVEIA